MSLLGTWIVVASLTASLLVSVYWFIRDRRLSLFLLHLFGIVLAFILLHQLFGFPSTGQVAMGSESFWNDAKPLVGLGVAMIIGMLCQHLYGYFSQPMGSRAAFDWGTFIAPVFMSPIVFIPLAETLKTTQIQSQGAFMALLVAFENGFFFKNYADQRGRIYAKTSVK